jgi:hypothetical protein
VSIFKYFSQEKHALDLINRGRMHWKALSSFREIEDGGIRGDPRDGVLVHAPEGGLDARGLDGKPVKALAGAKRFVASVKGDDIFVYCTSNIKSDLLFREFGGFCVEIEDVDKLILMIKARECPASKLAYEEITFGSMDYRPLSQIPAADWARPEKAVFIKPPEYAPQDEFRIALPKRGAFQAENVELMIEFEGVQKPPPAIQEPIFIDIGNITDFAKLHRL